MTISTVRLNKQRVIAAWQLTLIYVLAIVGPSTSSVAQELNGKLVLNQTHSGAIVATNNITIENFDAAYVVESTLATGNNIEASLVDGGASLTQVQTGTADAQSQISAGNGTHLRDTAVTAGNAINLSGDGNIDEFTAKIDQSNQGPTNAAITLAAGAIEFYAAFLDASGNDASLISDEFRSNFLLQQSNKAHNDGTLRQTGGIASATTQFVIAGNKANFGSGKQVPAREPAFLY